MSKLAEIKANVEAGKTKVVPGLVQEALDAGFDAKEILAAMVDAMSVVGDKFSAGEIFVPEMLIAVSDAKGVDVLSPVLAGTNLHHRQMYYRYSKGDLHDIGKNLVALMIGSTGFEMIDLGVDVCKNVCGSN